MVDYITTHAERERELAKSKQVKLFWTEEPEEENTDETTRTNN